MSMDLNMVYYNIRLSKNASNLFTIIITWIKYKRKRPPMGVIFPLDIFQDEMNKIFHEYKFIQTYIDGLLITT